MEGFSKVLHSLSQWSLMLQSAQSVLRWFLVAPMQLPWWSLLPRHLGLCPSIRPGHCSSKHLTSSSLDLTKNLEPMRLPLGPFWVQALLSALRLCLSFPLALGVNTSDIITLYISAIKALRELDPSMVILEVACEPIRKYLR